MKKVPEDVTLSPEGSIEGREYAVRPGDDGPSAFICTTCRQECPPTFAGFAAHDCKPPRTAAKPSTRQAEEAS